MPRDHTGEAATLGRARDVHELTDGESVDADDVARLELGKVVGGDAEFTQHDAAFDAGLREMSRLRLRHTRGAALAERHLHGGVAVRFGGLDLRDAIVGHVQHGNRDGAAVVGEDAGHAHFASY